MISIPLRPFYFVRHGRTDANAQGLMCGGRWDIALNEVGIAQANQLAPLLTDLIPRIEVVVASPMLRAQQTAKILNSVIALELITVEGFREWRVGQWEAKPWGEVPNPFTTSEDPPGGETRKDFEERLAQSLIQLFTTDSRLPLIVSHGAAAHSLFTVMGVDTLQIENCVLYQVTPNGSAWVLKKAI